MLMLPPSQREDAPGGAGVQEPGTEETSRHAGLLGLLTGPTRARIRYALNLVDESCVGQALPVLRTVGLGQHRQGRPGRPLPPVPRLPAPAAEPLLRALVDLSRAVAETDDLHPCPTPA